jgi:restriction system protein
VVTPRGVTVLSEKPKALSTKYLEKFQEFRDFRNREKRPETKVDLPATPIAGVPKEVISDQYELARRALASQVLEAVKSCSPAFFERLVIKVLVGMGYGGSEGDAGRAVGRSGDGGIDGVIKEDRLGLDMVYVQAKRWDDRTVGSPQIDQFAGALQKHKAQKGVFITTSSFTVDALKSVAAYSSRIVLIDGPELAKLMIDCDVGVSVVATYQIKRLDTDFFSEELGDA